MAKTPFNTPITNKVKKAKGGRTKSAPKQMLKSPFTSTAINKPKGK